MFLRDLLIVCNGKLLYASLWRIVNLDRRFGLRLGGSFFRHAAFLSRRCCNRCRLSSRDLGLGRPRLGYGADHLVLLDALDAANSNALNTGTIFGLAPDSRARREAVVTGCPLHDSLPCGVDGWLVAKLELELASVLLRDVAGFDELLECRANLVGAENKDLGDCDRVEPTLDPGPDCGEECRGTDDEDTW